MNDFKEIFKSSIDSMTTGNDIVQSAVRRAKKRSPSKRLTPLLSGAIAAAVLCTVTVSAVRYGWLNAIFGDSGNVISENYSEYSLAISGLETESRIPGTEISVNEVICDGRAMYVDFVINGMPPETVKSYCVYPLLTNSDGNFRGTLQNFHIGVTGETENSLSLYAAICSSEGVYIGDRAEFKLYTIDSETADPGENYDFRIAFEAAEKPSDMAVTVTPGCEAAFGSENKVKVTVESIRISPLTYHMTTGSLPEAEVTPEPGHDILSVDNPVFVMKDGSRIPLLDIYDSKSCSLDGNNVYETQAFFNRVFPVNDLAGIEIGDSYIEVDW